MDKVLWIDNGNGHDPLDQAYTAKILALPVEAGKIYEVTVSHDDFCPIFDGGPCRCDPDVEQKEIT